MNFVIDQLVENAIGESHIVTSGSFDLTTGLGTSTVESCSGAVLVCAGVDPVIGTPAATSDYTALNLDASDPDNITWEVSFVLSVAGFGEADSHSSFAAVLGTDPNAVDDDGDGYTEYELDCDDANPEVNPGAVEVPFNGIDDDCNPYTPGWGVPASIINAEYKESSDRVNVVFLVSLPVGAVLLLKSLRRRK
jgi:hypothetical protein